MHSLAQEVTHTVTSRNDSARPSRLYEFTQHPREYQRIGALPLQACARFVLETLVRFAGKADWLCWLSVAQIARLNPRSAKRTSYSTHSINTALRQLRALGLVSWERVRCLSHYPARDPETKAVVPGAGRFTQGGGRIWRVHLDKIRAIRLAGFRAPPNGTDLAGAIIHDRPGAIAHDRPSRIYSSPYGEQKGSRGDPSGAPPRASPAHAASETPSNPVAASSRSDGRAPTEPRKVASETPSSVDASRSSRHGPGPRTPETALAGTGCSPAPPSHKLPTDAELRRLEAAMAASWGYTPSQTRRGGPAPSAPENRPIGASEAPGAPAPAGSEQIGPERKRVT